MILDSFTLEAGTIKPRHCRCMDSDTSILTPRLLEKQVHMISLTESGKVALGQEILEAWYQKAVSGYSTSCSLPILWR